MTRDQRIQRVLRLQRQHFEKKSAGFFKILEQNAEHALTYKKRSFDRDHDQHFKKKFVAQKSCQNKSCSIFDAENGYIIFFSKF